MADSAANPTHRLVSVDALRGLAALLMVQQHIGVWMVDRAAYAQQIRGGFTLLNMTGGLAAPLFITLAGVGVALAGARNHGSPLASRAARVLRLRGLVLLGFGLLLNLLVPSWFSWGSFYVLHLLGAWLLLAPWCAAQSSRTLIGLALAVLAVAAVGQGMLGTPLRLTNPMMADVGKPGGPLRLALFEGQFPLFPWLALALGGLVAGRALAAGHPRRLLTGAAWAAGGAALARLPALVEPAAEVRVPWRAVCRASFYPLTTFFALGLFSLCLTLLALFVWLQRRGVLRVSSWWVWLGRTSLSLLFVHVVVFREGFEALGLRHRMSPFEALAVIIGFCLLWTVLVRAWSASGYRYGLEWWMRRVR